MAFTVLYDACVLYPAPLRDLLMYLALQDIYQARWTDMIHAEWTRSVLKNRPDLKREQLERTCQRMNAHVRGCLITGFEYLIDSIALPDPGDRHVVAAAIHGRVDVIVTYNLKHFPQVALQKHGLEALHPDVFLCSQFELDSSAVCEAVREQRQNLKNPPKTAAELLDTFQGQQLTRLVDHLRVHVHSL